MRDKIRADIEARLNRQRFKRDEPGLVSEEDITEEINAMTNDELLLAIDEKLGSVFWDMAGDRDGVLGI